MSLSIVLVGLLPILLFVIVDLYATPAVAIYTSVIAALFMGGFYYFQFHEWDHSLTAEIALFLFFGVISLKMDNPKLFKFQPVVVGLAMAGFLAWHEFFRGPYFLKAAELFEKISPEIHGFLAHPKAQALLAQFSFCAIFAFFFHALVLGWIALKRGSLAWGLWRVAIWPILLGLMFVLSV